MGVVATVEATHANSLQGVDGAGGRDCAAVLRYDGEVGGAGVVGHVEFRLVVVHVKRGVVRDAIPQALGEPGRGHVLDQLWEETKDFIAVDTMVM